MGSESNEYLQVATKGMAAYRAPSLMQPHKARQAFRDAYEGKINPLIGYYCGIGSLPTARVMAQMGVDIVWVDWEHSSCGVETMTDIVHQIQFMSEGRTMAFVRVPGHDHDSIGYALDAGASIVIPQGTRSAPACRWLPGIGDTGVDPTRSVWENFNDQAAIIIQIESEEGARNLDAILTAVGDQIDAVWMGTYDMRISMGFDGFWGPEPRFLEIVELYRNALKKHDIPDSGMCMGRDWAKGANKAFVIVGADAYALLGDMAIIRSARESPSAAG